MVTNNTGVDFDADVAYAVSQLGDSMTFSGTAYACVISPVSKGTRIEGPEGVFAEVAFEIVVRTSLFSTRPTADKKVTVGGTEYRIIRVETDEADAALNLFVEELTA